MSPPSRGPLVIRRAARFRLLRPRLGVVLVFAFSVLVATKAPGSSGTLEVDVRPVWQAGESHRYERVKSRRRIQPGKPDGKLVVRARIDVRVVEVTPGGFLLSWTEGKPRVDDPAHASIATNPIVKPTLEMVAGLRILLEVDAKDASIRGVPNWQEIQKKLRAWGDATATELGKQPAVPRVAIAQMQEQILQMSGTRAQVEKTASFQAEIALAATGRTYKLGEALEYAVELASPLGGPPIPRRNRFTLRSYDAKTGRATVEWSQTVNEHAARSAIERYMRELAEKMGRPVDDLSELRSLSVHDRGTFVLDAKTGWPLDVHTIRTTTLGAGSQVEEHRFTRQDPGDEPAR